VTLLT